MFKLRSVLLSLGALVTTTGLSLPISTLTAAAQENDVVGHYAIPDEGLGGHAGGPLYRDGTAGADGFLNLLLGDNHERGNVTNVSWKFSSDSTDASPKIDLLITLTPVRPDSDPLGLFNRPFPLNGLRADGQPYTFVTPSGFEIHANVSLDRF